MLYSVAEFPYFALSQMLQTFELIGKTLDSVYLHISMTPLYYVLISTVWYFK